MPLLILTNNQGILETRSFIMTPVLALNQPSMTQKAMGGLWIKVFFSYVNR